METTDATRRFYEHVWPHLASVLRWARLAAANDADGDDLAQETMLKAFKGMDTLRDAGNVRGWLLRILRNAMIDRVRASPKDVVSLADLALEPAAAAAGQGAGPAAPPDAGEFWRDPEAAMEGFSDPQVITALRHLPKEIRWTLLLVDVEGLDDADAAAILGVPVGTVKSRLHRGRAMLRGALEPLAKGLRATA